MAGIIHAAADRLNASVAGSTGSPTAPDTNPGAVGGKPGPAASAAEALYDVPTEFGDLTGLFGGEAGPATQFAPVNTSLVIPGGSIRGAIGGLVPDFTATTPGAQDVTPIPAVASGLGQSLRALLPGGASPSSPPPVGGAPQALVPISTAVQNNWNRLRQWLKV